MRYGMPWKGSKNSIAKWVVSNLPDSQSGTFVDLFCGGGAVSHAAAESRRFSRIIMNDISGSSFAFGECVNGDMDGYCTAISREEFFDCENTDLISKVLYSFGNDIASYLWSKEIEPIKVAASKMLSMPSMHERRVEYRRFMRLLSEFERTPDDIRHKGGLESLESLERLQSLESLESLERLQSLESLERLELRFSASDYSMVGIPDGATVYADIPYKSTNCGGYEGFDHERFYAWLSIVPFMVVVSEYTCPDGCVEVASIEKAIKSTNTGQDGKAVERLFVQERFADEYKESMSAGALFSLD